MTVNTVPSLPIGKIDVVLVDVWYTTPPADPPWMFTAVVTTVLVSNDNAYPLVVAKELVVALTAVVTTVLVSKDNA